MINYSHLPVKGFAQEVGARVNGKKQRLWRCCYYCAQRSVDALTEEEKKRKALEMFAQEQARLLNRSPLQRINNDHTARIQASLARSDRQRRMMTSLAQQGITWEELKKTYDEAVENGKNDMIQLNMGYFYAGMAIAFKEAVPTITVDELLAFLRAVATRMGEDETRDSITTKAQEIISLDLKIYDTPPKPIPRGSRKDKAAAERMRKTGITQEDLAYEKEIGYSHGWNSKFYFSACYATVVLVLHNRYGWGQEEIERFIERLEELKYEEISRIDILARAKRETGIDVDGIV